MTRPGQDSQTTNNNPARESTVHSLAQCGSGLFYHDGAEQLSVTAHSQSVNIYLSEADCEIVFIVLYFVYLERPVRGNNVPLNPEESVENI